ncbi:hypothetical protein MNBD_GAMMA01-1202, partial [hydrothermal vent metagenome]
YVDLNPIRAAIATTPENSDYTSIQERIKSNNSTLLNLGFDEDNINFTLADYCELVDATGRSIIANKKGYIDASLPPILNRLGLDEFTWLDELSHFKIKGKKAIGTLENLKQYVAKIKQKIRQDTSLNPALE